MSSKKVKNPEHYVDNKLLLAVMTEYRKAYLESKKKKLPRPDVPAYVGECIYKIANRFAMRHQYSKYPFVEEMVGDGIENCIKYLHNFDHEKSNYPFAYFTKIVHNAFIRRIKIEKKYLYTKYKATERAVLLDGMSESQDGDDSGMSGSMQQSDASEEYMNRFMADFESSMEKEVVKKKAAKLKKEQA